LKLSHYKELDGLRALAALMVVYFHLFDSIKGEGLLFGVFGKFTEFGRTGVSLFFVLSGFLITRILINSKSSPNYFSSFYFRRAVRIFPLYYFALVLYTVVMPIAFNIPMPPGQFYFWIYLQNIAKTFNWNIDGPLHFWSLAVEEHFYLFWPLIVYKLDRKRLKSCIFILIGIALLSRTILTALHYDSYYLTFSRLDELALGALLAILERDGKLVSKNANYFILLVAILIVPTLFLWKMSGGQGFQSLQILKYLLVALFYFGLVGFVISISNNNLFKKSLQVKPLLYTGKISYGLYVYHPLCISLIYNTLSTNDKVLNVVLSLALLYTVATLSYYFLELPFLRLKKRFDYNLVTEGRKSLNSKINLPLIQPQSHQPADHHVAKRK